MSDTDIALIRMTQQDLDEFARQLSGMRSGARTMNLYRTAEVLGIAERTLKEESEANARHDAAKRKRDKV